MTESIKHTETVVNLEPETVVRDFATLVYKIARGLSRRTVDPIEDLVQVGMIGLLEAQRRFDANQNTAFKTYATHFITGHIRHYLRDKQQLLKGPRSLQELAYRVQTCERHLKQSLKREPSAEDIARELDLPLHSIEEALTYLKQMRMLWLDQSYSDHAQETPSLLDTLSENEENPENQLDTRIYIEEGLRQLPELDQRLLYLRYFEDLTQAAIAQQLGMSQMDVCRKLKQAEKKLRKALQEKPDN